MAPHLPAGHVDDVLVVLAVGPEAAIDKAGFDAALRRAVQRFAEIELDGA